MTMRGPGSVPPMPAFPWIRTDPRGYTVILPQSTWDHAFKHMMYFAAPLAFHATRLTLSSPDYITDNLRRQGGLPRKANERYVRNDAYSGDFITVPVRTLLNDELIDGVLAKTGTRIALTIYNGSAQPGTKLWP